MPDHFDDPSYRSAMRLAIHLRAYLPLYVMAIGFVLLATLLPTVNKTGGNAPATYGGTNSGQQLATGGGTGGTAGGGGTSATAPDAAGGVGGTTVGGASDA